MRLGTGGDGPWRSLAAALQSIKNALAPDGAERFGLEVFPPQRWTIDNFNFWHQWVMPLGWQPGFGLHPRQEGWVFL